MGKIGRKSTDKRNQQHMYCTKANMLIAFNTGDVGCCLSMQHRKVYRF